MARDAATTSRIMAQIRCANTKPELLLRKALHRMGARYRIHVKDVTGKPDIVIAKLKFAVFVDGDFWHGNEHKIRGLAALEDLFPSNAKFWCKKIRQNMDRDQKTTEQLTRQGWTVSRIWASEILADPLQTAKIVLEKISELKARHSLLSPDLEPTP